MLDGVFGMTQLFLATKAMHVGSLKNIAAMQPLRSERVLTRAVLLLQEHGHLAREEILRDTRNHGLMPNAAERLKVLHLDFEEFTTIRYGPGGCIQVCPLDTPEHGTASVTLAVEPAVRVLT
jgi:hypothetical protein